MRKISLLFLSSLLSMSTLASSDIVEVNAYTTSYYPIRNSQLAAHVYYLDQVEGIEEQMSHQLSPSPQLAEAQIRQRMQSPEWKNMEQALANAYIGVTEGWKNGIVKVPAILFTNTQTGESAVIYGETDVAKALRLYQQNENR